MIEAIVPEDLVVQTLDSVIVCIGYPLDIKIGLSSVCELEQGPVAI